MSALNKNVSEIRPDKAGFINSDEMDKFCLDVFLAGTIDNGNSIDWQANTKLALIRCLRKSNVLVNLYNPRRTDWNPNATELDVEKQINWEMTAMSTCNIIFMNFLPDSKSPITLLELGALSGTNKKIIVVCPKEFYRYTNVKVFCDIKGIEVFNSYSEGLIELIRVINE